MSKKFGKSRRYQVGERDPESESSNPAWKSKTNVQTFTGEQLHAWGCPTVTDFLEKNPANFKPNRTYTFYEIDESGKETYLDEGYMPARSPKNDDVPNGPQPQQPPGRTSKGGGTLQLYEGLQDRITDLARQSERENTTVEALLRRIDALDEHNRYLVSELMKSERELEQKDAEIQRMKEMQQFRDESREIVDGLKDDIRKLEDKKSGGLGDIDWTPFIPHVMDMLKAFMQKGVMPGNNAIGGGMNGMNHTPPQQQQSQQGQPTSDPGSYDYDIKAVESQPVG